MTPVTIRKPDGTPRFEEINKGLLNFASALISTTGGLIVWEFSLFIVLHGDKPGLSALLLVLLLAPTICGAVWVGRAARMLASILARDIGSAESRPQPGPKRDVPATPKTTQ